MIPRVLNLFLVSQVKVMTLYYFSKHMKKMTEMKIMQTQRIYQILEETGQEDYLKALTDMEPNNHSSDIDATLKQGKLLKSVQTSVKYKLIWLEEGTITNCKCQTSLQETADERDNTPSFATTV